MQFRRFIFLALPLALALGACGTPGAALRIDPQSVAYAAPQFKDAIALGQIAGGSSGGWFATTGITNDEFRNGLTFTLHDAGVLAPDPATAHWRLDVALDLVPAERGSLSDQQVDTDITYRLFALPSGKKVFERMIRTSDVEAADATKQVFTFVLAGLGGLASEGQGRLEVAYIKSVRRSLGTFLTELRKWGEPGGAYPAASLAPEPPAQPPSPPAANAAASLNATMAALAATAPKPAPQTAPPLPSTPAQVATLPPAAAPPKRFGNEVAFRCPAAGTEIDFRSGLTRVFAPETAAEPDCAYRGPHGAVETTAFGTYKREAAHALSRLWPLRVGNKVSLADAVTMDRHLHETYRVVSHELVTVPAGTFDAFVISWDAIGEDQYTKGYHETAKFWYAPALGYIVKIEHHLQSGLYARVANDEAVRVTGIPARDEEYRPGWQPNPDKAVLNATDGQVAAQTVPPPQTPAAMAETAPAPASQTAAPSPSTPAQVAAAPPPAVPAPKRFGDEVAFDCPAAGTEIDFRSGLRRVFAPRDAARPDCAFESARGSAETTAFGPYQGEAAKLLGRLWPLRVGKRVSFPSSSGAAQRYSETYRVVRHELVTVPAGTFDTFVIRWDSTGQDQYANGYHETATFWYAPALGYVVKVEEQLEGGLYARVAADEAVRVIRR